MYLDQLKHGDVLLYEFKTNQSLFVKSIRFATKSQFSHTAVIQDVGSEQVLLEQLKVRTQSILSMYTLISGEVIHVMRPRFTVPSAQKVLFDQKPYGILGILDCALNHLIGLVIRTWQHRPMLAKLFKSANVVCSAAVALVDDLKNNTKWCLHPECVEPDDYYNHQEDFEYLGILEWRDATDPSS
jgi:hypothetical protein